MDQQQQQHMLESLGDFLLALPKVAPAEGALRNTVIPRSSRFARIEQGTDEDREAIMRLAQAEVLDQQIRPGQRAYNLVRNMRPATSQRHSPMGPARTQKSSLPFNMGCINIRSVSRPLSSHSLPGSHPLPPFESDMLSVDREPTTSQSGRLPETTLPHTTSLPQHVYSTLGPPCTGGDSLSHAAPGAPSAHPHLAGREWAFKDLRGGGQLLATMQKLSSQQLPTPSSTAAGCTAESIDPKVQDSPGLEASPCPPTSAAMPFGASDDDVCLMSPFMSGRSAGATDHDTQAAPWDRHPLPSSLLLPASRSSPDDQTPQWMSDAMMAPRRQSDSLRSVLSHSMAVQLTSTGPIDDIHAGQNCGHNFVHATSESMQYVTQHAQLSCMAPVCGDYQVQQQQQQQYQESLQYGASLDMQPGNSQTDSLSPTQEAAAAAAAGAAAAAAVSTACQAPGGVCEARVEAVYDMSTTAGKVGTAEEESAQLHWQLFMQERTRRAAETSAGLPVLQLPELAPEHEDQVQRELVRVLQHNESTAGMADAPPVEVVFKAVQNDNMEAALKAAAAAAREAEDAGLGMFEPGVAADARDVGPCQGGSCEAGGAQGQPVPEASPEVVEDVERAAGPRTTACLTMHLIKQLMEQRSRQPFGMNSALRQQVMVPASDLDNASSSSCEDDEDRDEEEEQREQDAAAGVQDAQPVGGAASARSLFDILQTPPGSTSGLPQDYRQDGWSGLGAFDRDHTETPSQSSGFESFVACLKLSQPHAASNLDQVLVLAQQLRAKGGHQMLERTMQDFTTLQGHMSEPLGAQPPTTWAHMSHTAAGEPFLEPLQPAAPAASHPEHTAVKRKATGECSMYGDGMPVSHTQGSYMGQGVPADSQHPTSDQFLGSGHPSAPGALFFDSGAIRSDLFESLPLGLQPSHELSLGVSFKELFDSGADVVADHLTASDLLLSRHFTDVQASPPVQAAGLTEEGARAPRDQADELLGSRLAALEPSVPPAPPLRSLRLFLALSDPRLRDEELQRQALEEQLPDYPDQPLSNEPLGLGGALDPVHMDTMDLSTRLVESMCLARAESMCLGPAALDVHMKTASDINPLSPVGSMDVSHLMDSHTSIALAAAALLSEQSTPVGMVPTPGHGAVSLHGAFRPSSNHISGATLPSHLHASLVGWERGGLNRTDSDLIAKTMSRCNMLPEHLLTHDTCGGQGRPPQRGGVRTAGGSAVPSEATESASRVGSSSIVGSSVEANVQAYMPSAGVDQGGGGRALQPLSIGGVYCELSSPPAPPAGEAASSGMQPAAIGSRPLLCSQPGREPQFFQGLGAGVYGAQPGRACLSSPLGLAPPSMSLGQSMQLCSSLPMSMHMPSLSDMGVTASMGLPHGLGAMQAAAGAVAHVSAAAPSALEGAHKELETEASHRSMSLNQALEAARTFGVPSLPRINTRLPGDTMPCAGSPGGVHAHRPLPPLGLRLDALPADTDSHSLRMLTSPTSGDMGPGRRDRGMLDASSFGRQSTTDDLSSYSSMPLTFAASMSSGWGSPLASPGRRRAGAASSRRYEAEVVSPKLRGEGSRDSRAGSTGRALRAGASVKVESDVPSADAFGCSALPAWQADGGPQEKDVSDDEEASGSDDLAAQHEGDDDLDEDLDLEEEEADGKRRGKAASGKAKAKGKSKKGAKDEEKSAYDGLSEEALRWVPVYRPDLDPEAKVPVNVMDVEDRSGRNARGGGGSKQKTLERWQLKAGFHLPITFMSIQLGMGVTVLKKTARNMDVKRWPYRKFSSMARLIEALVNAQKRARVENREKDVAALEEGLYMVRSFLEQLYSEADADIPGEIKKLRQANFKTEYKQRQAQGGASRTAKGGSGSTRRTASRAGSAAFGVTASASDLASCGMHHPGPAGDTGF